MKKKWYFLALSFVILSSAAVIWGLKISEIPSPLFGYDYSRVVLAEDGSILRVFLNTNEQWLLPDDESEIPPKLKAAVICFEDKRFEKHRGIDFFAVARALYQNIKGRGRISGASTITMQVARLMEPKPRTIFNKLQEMGQALRIERRYGKDEIMKLYLLHAPYGSNILGYRAASLRYFAQEPANLSWAQAATLAVLPNNPANVNPMRNRQQLKEKRDNLLLNLHEQGTIDEATYKLAVLEPIPEGQYPFPIKAPHLAERLAAGQTEPIVKTTIKQDMQSRAADLLAAHIEKLRPQGVKNGAVLVAETATGLVRAYAASQDYFDDENLGKIDGIQMKRSSASTLKPFLYALAMDKGLIVRESLLEDLQANYGGYTPYNADGIFHGMVRADEALRRSLNVPAVQLLNSIGIEPFFDFLKKAGLKSLKGPPQNHGLSLILGSAPVSLWELAELYLGLGNLGEFSDLVVLKGEEAKKEAGEERLLSAGASFLILETLKEVARPQADYNWRHFQSAAPIAWKTGTSYGGSDAWSVGVSPQFVIAVWVGNFTGGEIKGLSGIKAAAPLLFQVFNSLEKNPALGWFAKPAGELKKILVSAETGYRLRENTVPLREVLAPAAAEPLRLSPYEKTLFLNGAETMQVCSLCWERGDYKKVQKAVYPPQVQGASLPPHNPRCPALLGENHLKFVYPQQGSLIFVPRGKEGYQEVTLEAASTFAGERLFWYLDHSYLGETEGSHRLSVVLENGRHNLHIIDTTGIGRSITFESKRR
ncbi:MAG TPA: penicillin-binding protein 1C [Firmicutes bacterium]|nr:penicillin-binding protein 1C [Bacillota bacterium]